MQLPHITNDGNHAGIQPVTSGTYEWQGLCGVAEHHRGMLGERGVGALAPQVAARMQRQAADARVAARQAELEGIVSLLADVDRLATEAEEDTRGTAELVMVGDDSWAGSCAAIHCRFDSPGSAHLGYGV